VAHARKEAARQGLDCRFFEMDLTRLPEDFAGQVGPVDAITFWFGEFHSFGPELVDGFLPRLAEVLRPGGVFVLEYQPLNIFFQEGQHPVVLAGGNRYSARGPISGCRNSAGTLDGWSKRMSTG
jgi:hypothetical protein